MKIMNYNEKLAKIAVHKSLLKEYSNSSNERIVYMDNGTEFQIQIFNPYSYIIGVSFNFNNNLQGNSNLLVLRPGERVWLDRYLDNESRLMFSTYKVGASKEIREAIKDNGNLCIKFFKEQEKHYWDNNNIWVNDHSISTIDVYYSQPTYVNTSITCDNNANISQTSAASYTSLTCDNNANISQASAASYTSTYGNSLNNSRDLNLNNNYSYTVKTSSVNVGTNSCINNNIAKKSIETGRIEKGSHSNQKFNSVHKDFEYFPFKTEYIKILPSSQKQINTNDLKKIYCHECGRKINQKYKFCPYCGAQQ